MGVAPPVIFITGHADVPMTVRAMKAGAVEFLTKPFRDVELLDAIHAAIEPDRDRRQTAASLEMLRLRHGQLTVREREVMALVAGGLANKQVAAAARVKTSPGALRSTPNVDRTRTVRTRLLAPSGLSWLTWRPPARSTRRASSASRTNRRWR